MLAACRRTARHAFRRPSLALLACALATLAGCITIDGTLKSDGSGTVEVSYKVSPSSTETLEKRRFTSPQVKLESFTLKPDGTAVAKLSFDDPAKLSTVEVFRNVTIKRQRDGEQEQLVIGITNLNASKSADTGKPGPRISIGLPGKVLEANWKATVQGKWVTWRFSLVDFLKEKTIELTARYLVPPADQPPSAEAPRKDPGEGKEPPAKP